jgi:hypothetical protein
MSMRGYEERWSDSRRYQPGLVADDSAIDVRSGQSRCLPEDGDGQGRPKIAGWFALESGPYIISAYLWTYVITLLLIRISRHL